MDLLQTDKIIEHIDIKSLIYGFAGVLSCLIIALFYIFISGPGIVQERQSTLASHTVTIHYNEPKEPDIVESSSAKILMIQQPKTHTPLSKIKKDESLSIAPDPNIIEETNVGFSPIISGTGQTPFTTYKKPFFDDISTPVISLAVLDYGLSERLSAKMLQAFPSEITFILNPYTIEAETWQQKARKAGHEIWLHLPIQNNKYPAHDYGPKTLLAHSSLSYNQNHLAKILSSATGYTGVAGETDNVFARSKPMLQSILRNIFKRGLGYYELNINGLLFIEAFAMNNNSPYIRNQFYINGSPEDVKEQLIALEKKATKDGYSLGYIVANPSIVPLINQWATSLKDREFILAPLSYISVAQNQRPKPINAKEVDEVGAVPVHNNKDQ